MMENLNKLFTEKDIEEVSERILSSTKEKILEQISNAFYKENSNFLYEHYNNFKNSLKNDLIKEITEEFINDPTNYQFRELRDKLFLENENQILKSLTDQAIYNSLETIILKYSHKNEIFSWGWNQGITKFILNNWDNFKNNSNIKDGFGREIERLNDIIKNLQEKLNLNDNYY